MSKNKFLSSRMLLSEHAKALSELKEQRKKNQLFHVPEYDEQQFGEWESLLRKSMRENIEVEIKYMGSTGPVMAKGTVVEVDSPDKSIFLKDGSKSVVIYCSSILEIEGLGYLA